MAKPALSPIPFEKDAALEHDSPALSTSIYSDPQSPIDDTEIVACPPKIICSPKRTGKTTLINHIVDKQRSISNVLGEENCTLVVIALENGASESLLRQALASQLDAPFSCHTLTEFMERSKLINESSRDRIIIAVPDADNLATDAVRWLLYNVRQMLLNPILPRSFQCQILIDGSFELESITTPDSEFPLPQIFPRDFTQAEQTAFVAQRLAKMNIGLAAPGFQTLWDTTKGDKYLTQAICLNLVEGLESSVDISLTEDHVGESVERFLAADPSTEPLKGDWVNCFAELSQHVDARELGLKSLLYDLMSEWEFQSRRVHQLAYQGGIIRRKDSVKLETRPFVIDTFEKAFGRVCQTRATLDHGLVLEGVNEEALAEAKDLVDRIIKASYFDNLTSLHAGAARKVTETAIEIEASVLGEGTYRGKWEVTTDETIKIGEELWAVLWSWEDHRGRRDGEIRTFPLRPLTYSVS